MSYTVFSPTEDAALAVLLCDYGVEWKAHIREQSALDDRDPTSCEKHLWHTNYFGLGGTLREAAGKVTHQAWPEPDPKNPLFTDNPRAIDDHGSPGFRF